MENDRPAAPMLEGLPIHVNDVNDVWSTLRIASCVPLPRLDWVWNSRGAAVRDSSNSARAVFEVSTSQISVADVASREPYDWYLNPYVYILVTTVKELETSSEVGAWSRIRNFVDECREHVREYIIILAATDLDFQQHKRIWDKLRSEVNLTAKGRERVVVVPPAEIREEEKPITLLQHSASHKDLLVRLLECIHDGVRVRVQLYEGEVSRSFDKRDSPSWSFLEHFALKEGMAFVFVQLGRRDLAVTYYDEIETVMGDLTENGPGQFANVSAFEAAQGVTDPNSRDYREQLVRGTITEIDLRTYLFGRKVSFLRLDRKYHDISERGIKYINTLARRCAEEAVSEESDVSGVYRDTWVFTATRGLATILASAIPTQKESAQALSVQLASHRERHTARLIAGFHVNALKAFVGLAHVVLPGCLSPSDPSDGPANPALVKEARNNSNAKLKQALMSKRDAETLHSEIANAAASLYEMGGRSRGAAALDGDAGFVCIRNESYNEAEKLLSAQCQRFVNDNGWDYLHRRQRTELARVEKQLNRVQEYLVSCLTLLYMNRSVRRLGRERTLPEEKQAYHSKEAAFWAKESAQAASRLPRVMKYKTDRLFEVSVLRSAKCWHEGDVGTATIRIVSDLPTSITLDSVMLECVWADSPVTNPSKSALHNREDGESPGAAPSSPGLSPESVWLSSARDTSAGAPSEVSDILVLESVGEIVLNEGLTEVEVHVAEVPHRGRYRVSHVAMFLGKLKLVQAASKAPPSPVVTTKGSPTFKHSSLSGTPAPQADFSRGIVRFPLFFSSARAPSASIVIDGQAPLFVAPNCIQYVNVKIVAGEHGLGKGARVACTLLNESKSRFNAASRFIELVDISQEDSNSIREGDNRSVLKVIRIGDPSIEVFEQGDSSADAFEQGGSIIQQALRPGAILETRVPIRLLACARQMYKRNNDDDTDDLHSCLRLSLACAEANGARTRPFVCETEAALHFICPVDVSARIDLHSSWHTDDGGADSVAPDGAHLRPGGTLVCSVASRMPPGQELSLEAARLVTPDWLALAPNAPSPHDQLLPCALGPAGVFVCAFDVLIREEAVRAALVPATDAEGTGLDDVTTGAIGRRMSRLNGALAGVTVSADGIPRLEPEGRADAADATARDNAGAQGADADATEARAETGGSAGESEGEHDDATESARDIVDLSTPPVARSPDASSTSAPTRTDEASYATLQLTVRAGGLEEAMLERRVSLQALRASGRRFRVTRAPLRAGAAGRAQELSFRVRATGPGEGADAAADGGAGMGAGTGVGMLQYEVDADPTTWLVVGRRRGRVSASGGATATLVPLRAGRQRVPGVRLFEGGCGRGVLNSRCEVVDDGVQVAVLPAGVVVCACGRRDDGRVLPLPDVVASDRFFAM